MPTGFGKSRIFQTFARIKNSDDNEGVVLIIVPLQSIIKKQVNAMNHVGIEASDLSNITEDDLKSCKAKVLFSSAETALMSNFTSELKDSSSKLHNQLC